MKTPNQANIVAVLKACIVLNTENAKAASWAPPPGPARSALSSFLRVSATYVSDCVAIVQVKNQSDAASVFNKLASDESAVHARFGHFMRTLA